MPMPIEDPARPPASAMAPPTIAKASGLINILHLLN
jgi:hypothetical protein